MPQNQFIKAQAVTPSDTVDLPRYSNGGVLTDAFMVGVTGNVAAVFADNSVVTLIGCQAGAVYYMGLRRINAQNTSSTGIVALYQGA